MRRNGFVNLLHVAFFQFCLHSGYVCDEGDERTDLRKKKEPTGNLRLNLTIVCKI